VGFLRGRYFHGVMCGSESRNRKEGLGLDGSRVEGSWWWVDEIC
jgi:hypothetical protein